MTTPSASRLLLSHPIAFIGGGNMARSLIGGLVAGGADAAKIRVAEPVEALRAALAAEFGVQVFAGTGEAVHGADMWLFAVKPQVMRDVCRTLSARALAQRPVAVSIAAGITTAQLQAWLGGELPVVRCMPNTPALLGAGVTGLFASAQVDRAGRARAEGLLASAGKTVWIDEEARMDAVTAVSGSGPAYVFLLAEAMEAAAKAEGLPDQAARTLVLETLLGAASC
jgi:pyrroline-5-carboxylate reductase